MSGSGSQTNSSGGGFWKIHHAAIGIAILLLIVFAVRSCGNDAEDQIDAEGGSDDGIPRQAIVVEIPAAQWQGQHAPVTQQVYPPAPVYPAQQPQYGYTAQQPQYGYPPQPPVQRQPVYQVDPENPWAVQRQQPVYGGGSQGTQRPAPRWGQPSQQRPVYPQPGISQFRPLDENSSATQDQRAPTAAPSVPRSAAPYDRLSGSSYGENSNAQGAWPYAGTHPGYYGTTPYGGVPGGYPGAAYPGAVYPGGW